MLEDQEPFPAADRPEADLEQTSGIYLFDMDGESIYVGQTLNLARRLRQHLDLATNDATLVKRMTAERAATEDLPAGIKFGSWSLGPPAQRRSFDRWEALFNEEQHRLRTESRIRVVSFDYDERGLFPSLAEHYVHMDYGTKYNFFGSS